MTDADQIYQAIADIFKSSWREHANCIDKDWELFSNPEMVNEGKEICNACPVKVECLDNAIYFNDGFLRGGLTEQERNSVELHRKRHLAAFRFDAARHES